MSYLAEVAANALVLVALVLTCATLSSRRARRREDRPRDQDRHA